MSSQFSNNNTDRKLAAIFFADIVGYTALMQQGEANAMTILTQFETITKEKVTKHRGEIIKNYGDGSLILFSSTVHAVKCAEEMQRAFQSAPQVPLRIGIHVGEVIHKGNDVFGNGVNITSRVESMGVAGAVLLSRTAYERVQNQEQFELTSLGVFEFKNVEAGMEVFALANKGIVVPNKNKLVGKFKNKNRSFSKKTFATISGIIGLLLILYYTKPFASATIEDRSIAVLPFEYLNGEEEEQYFSDGISIDILSHLTGIKDLQVISFNSSKKYRHTELDHKDIGDALGVRHLLSGSVQTGGDKIVLRTSLVEAATNKLLWSDRYNLELAEIFETQATVSKKIAQILQAELLPTVAARISNRPTDNLVAYEEYSQGRYLWGLRGLENLKNAESHLIRAIELDSTFALAHAALAQVYSVQAELPDGDQERLFLLSKQLSEKALSLDPTLGDAHASLGVYYNRLQVDLKKSEEYLKAAIRLEPGNATAHQWYAETLVNLGRVQDARREIDTARKLDPGKKILELIDAIVMLSEDKYLEAMAVFERLYHESPDLGPVKFFEFQTLLQTGNVDEASKIDLDESYKNMSIAMFRKDIDALRSLYESISTSSLGH